MSDYAVCVCVCLYCAKNGNILEIICNSEGRFFSLFFPYFNSLCMKTCKKYVTFNSQILLVNNVVRRNVDSLVPLN